MAGNMGVKVRFWKGAWWIFIGHQGRRQAKTRRPGDCDARRRAHPRGARRRDLRLGAGAAKPGRKPRRRVGHGADRNLKASTIGFYTDNLERHVMPVLGQRRWRR